MESCGDGPDKPTFVHSKPAFRMTGSRLARRSAGVPAAELELDPRDLVIDGSAVTHFAQLPVDVVLAGPERSQCSRGLEFLDHVGPQVHLFNPLHGSLDL